VIVRVGILSVGHEKLKEKHGVEDSDAGIADHADDDRDRKRRVNSKDELWFLVGDHETANLLFLR